MAAQNVIDPVQSLSVSGEPEETTQVTSTGHPMEIYISHVLRIGVLISATIIVTGLVLYLVNLSHANGSPTPLNDMLNNGGHSQPVSPSTIWHGIGAGDPIAIIQLGVLALILTPTTRVAMTAGLFLAQRDKIFVTITTVVFVILVLGLIGVGS